MRPGCSFRAGALSCLLNVVDFRLRAICDESTRFVEIGRVVIALAVDVSGDNLPSEPRECVNRRDAAVSAVCDKLHDRNASVAYLESAHRFTLVDLPGIPN